MVWVRTEYAACSVTGRRRSGRRGSDDRTAPSANGHLVKVGLPKTAADRHCTGFLTRRSPHLIVETGLPPVRLHDLRHGAAGLVS